MFELASAPAKGSVLLSSLASGTPYARGEMGSRGLLQLRKQYVSILSQNVHGGRMKCRHKPSILQAHHELFPAHTGVMRCIAQPLRGSTTTKKASDSQTQTRPNRLHTHTQPPRRLAHPRSPIPPLSTLTSRATQAHPTSPRSIGFCAIWGCISSSSSYLRTCVV